MDGERMLALASEILFVGLLIVFVVYIRGKIGRETGWRLVSEAFPCPDLNGLPFRRVMLCTVNKVPFGDMSYAVSEQGFVLRSGFLGKAFSDVVCIPYAKMSQIKIRRFAITLLEFSVFFPTDHAVRIRIAVRKDDARKIPQQLSIIGSNHGKTLTENEKNTKNDG